MPPVAALAQADVQVRAAQPGDAGDVARLLGLLGYPCSSEEALERILVVAQDPRQQLLLAETGGHACGLVALYVLYSLAHGADLARISALVVAPDHARHGIGRRLLREVEALSRRLGIHRIEVTSNRRREAAHAFYLGCGYGDDSRRFVKMLGD